LSLASSKVTIKSTTGGFTTNIIGGTNAINSQFPWTIYYNYSISSLQSVSCMGALISSQWVLTSAHCLFGRTGITINAYAGSTNLFDRANNQIRTSTTYQIHPSYTPNSDSNDIALFKVSSPFSTTSRVKPIAISLDPPTSLDKVFYTAGFGITENNNINSVPLRNLKWISLRYFAKDFCASKLSQYNDTTMLCAGGTTVPRADTCNGDSGSALIRSKAPKNSTFNRGIVGITSFGSSLCATGTPGGYTRVAYYYESFIKPIVGTVGTIRETATCRVAKDCKSTTSAIKYACIKGKCSLIYRTKQI